MLKFCPRWPHGPGEGVLVRLDDITVMGTLEEWPWDGRRGTRRGLAGGEPELADEDRGRCDVDDEARRAEGRRCGGTGLVARSVVLGPVARARDAEVDAVGLRARGVVGVGGVGDGGDARGRWEVDAAARRDEVEGWPMPMMRDALGVAGEARPLPLPLGVGEGAPAWDVGDTAPVRFVEMWLGEEATRVGVEGEEGSMDFGRDMTRGGGIGRGGLEGLAEGLAGGLMGGSEGILVLRVRWGERKAPMEVRGER